MGCDETANGVAELVQVIERALIALRHLAEHQELGVTDLAKRVGIDKSTMHRILSTLCQHGYVYRNPLTRRYTLGAELFHLGRAFLRCNGLAHAVRPALERLADRTGDTALLAIYDRGTALVLDRIEGVDRVPTMAEVGGRFPIHGAATGKVLLAYLPPDELEHLVSQVGLTPVTPSTITDLTVLSAHLAEVRSQGYAISDEEAGIDQVGIGAPLRDPRGRVVAAISVAGPVARFPARRRGVLIEEVLRTAAEASELLVAAQGVALFP